MCSSPTALPNYIQQLACNTILIGVGDACFKMVSDAVPVNFVITRRCCYQNCYASYLSLLLRACLTSAPTCTCMWRSGKEYL